MTKLAGATLNQTALNWESNYKHIAEAIKTAQENQVDILCLPELCITGYGCEDLFLGNWIYDRALQELEKVRPLCTNILVAVGLPVKFEGKNYNTTCIVKDTEILGFYVKQNLANDGVHYEPRWFTPGTSEKVDTITINNKTYDFGDIVLEFGDIKMGFEICEDAWREVRPACRLYEKGVNLILNPSASHFAFDKTLAREELVVSSSKNFHCTYLYANLLGNEAGRMIYDGEMLIARHGTLIQRNEWLSFQDVQLIYANVDFSNENETYSAPKKYARDKNTEFLKAETLALYDYLRKSRSKGFILSLSGGADSSSIAVLVAEMVRRGIAELGVDKFLSKAGLSSIEARDVRGIVSAIFTCAYQGTVNSSEDTFNSAKELASQLGATFYHWLIDEEVASYTKKIEKAIDRPLTWEQDDITLQNIQARARSPIIWMLANINNALLLTTSNRSEGDVGYATMDGDTSGSISPIAAVDKHFIIGWLNWAEQELGYSALSHVNSLQPSAELRPLENKQTDETDLMPYHIIVEIEKLAIKEHQSPLEVFKALSPKNLEADELLKQHITRFYTLWSRNQWKRERIAPSFHVDDFNVDPRTWCRFPILSGSFKEELEALNNY
ncbi:NAD(+) synthase [Fulvivirga maritima]|uniref:NAD(+) synthase n=1 Tax=Fulvivirga maritima TaxID=2904247 RepID=UPI001F01B817|nr:NAD(+) synthase [Fulvivirga maritima]UII29436.1 NAD(+) synthase [Fulvivirga maritima]